MLLVLLQTLETFSNFCCVAAGCCCLVCWGVCGAVQEKTERPPVNCSQNGDGRLFNSPDISHSGQQSVSGREERLHVSCVCLIGNYERLDIREKHHSRCMRCDVSHGDPYVSNLCLCQNFPHVRYRTTHNIFGCPEDPAKGVWHARPPKACRHVSRITDSLKNPSVFGSNKESRMWCTPVTGATQLPLAVFAELNSERQPIICTIREPACPIHPNFLHGKSFQPAIRQSRFSSLLRSCGVCIKESGEFVERGGV